MNRAFTFSTRLTAHGAAWFLAAALLSPSETGAQEPYAFHCRDYISTDDARAPQSAFSYDDSANTFTIRAAGTNNIAFKMDDEQDNAYYITNKQEWFLVQGSGLGIASGQSCIWWFNGYNQAGKAPTFALKDSDGSTLLLWDIPVTEGLCNNMDFSQPNIAISANGKDLIHAIGLTSATGRATISDVGYYAKWEVTAAHPVLLSRMGYTAASLTDTLRTELDAALLQAEAAASDTTDAESLQALNQSVETARNALLTAGETDYDTLYASLCQLREALSSFKRSASAAISYEQTDHGLHATLGDLHTHISFYADDIVRITKGHEATPSKQSLAVVAQPTDTVRFNMAADEAQDIVTLTSPALSVRYHLSTGQVETERPDGSPLLREKENSSKMLAIRDGPNESFHISQTFLLDEDEDIYGMGQLQDGKLSRRGTSFSLAQNNTQVCIPYFHSSKNYALFWDNYSPTQFTDNSQGTHFVSTGREIDYYVLTGDKGGDVVAAMRRLTGRCPMPALWNFGLYQSKERYTSATEVMQVVNRYRNLRVPLDCVVQDWQYWGDNAHWNALEFLSSSYANYANMINYVHNKNAKLMISIWSNFGPETKPYAELDSLGRLIPVETYPPGYGVHPYDAYGAGARDVYWKHLYNGLASKGIDAYWMDSTEPDYVDWKDSDLDYVTETGQTWRELRNAFPLVQVGGVHDHHRGTATRGDSALASKRVSILTRSAFAGQQRYGANTWSGDVTASWDNLAAQIPAGCNLALCGIPYWNSDIGGFFTGSFRGIDDPAWRRLYMRWVQFGTFTPMMRFHGAGTPREIYQFGTKGDAKGDFDQILKYVKIRYRLLPYLYSTAWQIHSRHAMFMSPLAVAFDADEQGRGVTDEYMFGETFLVAPVLSDSTTMRHVYLPAGTSWTDFWTGESLDGGQQITKEAAVDIMPLYVRAGSILPWGPDVQYATEQPWDSLEIRIYPGADGQFTLYEDENDNYDYEQGLHSGNHVPLERRGHHPHPQFPPGFLPGNAQRAHFPHQPGLHPAGSGRPPHRRLRHPRLLRRLSSHHPLFRQPAARRHPHSHDRDGRQSCVGL